MVRPGVKSAIKSEFVSLVKEFWRDIKEHLIEKSVDGAKKALYSARKRFSGASIAIIGPPGAGKTTLLKVLRNPTIPAEELRIYNKTEVEPHEGIKVDFKLSVDTDEQIRFRFKIKKNSDVGGEQYIRDQHWTNAVANAAVVIYVLDITKVLSNEGDVYVQRAIEDFDWLLEQSQKLREDFAVVIAMNKVDLVTDRQNYRTFTSENVFRLDQIKQAALDRWPAHLTGHFKGGVFLSLIEPGLRAFTLNGLVTCFVGDDLMELYRKPHVGSQ